MTNLSVFYSWQSDLPNNTNRRFIQEALERAVKQLKQEIAIEFVVDRDTWGIAGVPNIAESILDKIRQTSVFVADVSITNRDKKPSPNPNVIFETGYALATLGEKQVITVCNTAFGTVEELPFDLRFRRAITYKCSPSSNEKAAVRKTLADLLKAAIELALPSPIKLMLDQRLEPPALQLSEARRMAFNVPVLPLLPAERFWLELMYKEFNSGLRTPPHKLRRTYRAELGSSFDPATIDARLLAHIKNSHPKRYDITLLGIANVDPDTDWLWKSHLLLSYIKQLIRTDPSIDRLSVSSMAKEIRLTTHEVSLILSIAPGTKFAQAGGGPMQNHYLTEYFLLNIGAESTFKFYESYEDIGKELWRFFSHG